MRIALVGMDDETLVEDIGAKGAVLETSARSKGLDMIFFAANAPRDLARLAAIAGRLEPAGAIWLIRAKGRGAPISERESMAAGKQAGLVDVKVVSYSDTHSAEKYVIPVARRRAARPRPRAAVDEGTASSDFLERWRRRRVVRWAMKRRAATRDVDVRRRAMRRL